MNSDETRAHLSEALGGLAQADDTLFTNARLTQYYVIAVFEDDNGPTFCRYTPAGQADWTDMGLLRLAAKLDEGELFDDDEG